MAEDKKKNRLSMVKVRELSIVDRPANKSTFLLFKRDDGGGEVTNEELQKAFDAMKAEKEDLEKKVQELEETITKAKVPPDGEREEASEESQEGSGRGRTGPRL